VDYFQFNRFFLFTGGAGMLLSTRHRTLRDITPNQTTLMKRYSNDPREMTARFPSTCAESGKVIRKGDSILYWPSSRSAYLIGSAPKAEQEFREFQSLAFEEDNGFCCY
jgi:hypothetical protein